MELRDKLFTEEQYIKQLAKYYCRIEKLNSMIEQSEKEGDEISPDLYGRLFDCRVYTIVTMYFREARYGGSSQLRCDIQ